MTEKESRDEGALRATDYLPRPWTSGVAMDVYRSISSTVTEKMLAEGEDPTDAALYLLRHEQVLILLRAYIERNVPQKKKERK